MANIMDEFQVEEFTGIGGCSGTRPKPPKGYVSWMDCSKEVSASRLRVPYAVFISGWLDVLIVHRLPISVQICTLDAIVRIVLM